MNEQPETVFHSASALGAQVDTLFLALLGITGTAALAVAATVVAFTIRYRAGSKVNRNDPPVRAPWVEVSWTVLPLLIFMGVFAWSSAVFSQFYRAPSNAVRIHVLAKQWMWKLEHANGKREIDELHVPLGVPIELTMTSEDAIHSFYIPAFRVKQDVLPARYTSLWFTATRVGRFNLFCAEFCGTDHSRMHGAVVVMPPAQFAQWLASGPIEPDLVTRGARIYRDYGCSGCHEPKSTVHAPGLIDLYGSVVHLSDGATAVADDNYLRDSILLPKKQVPAGFEPTMPSFQGQLDEDDLAALLAYLRSMPGATR